MHLYIIHTLTPAVTCGTPVAYLWVAAVVETAPRKAAVPWRLTGVVCGGGWPFGVFSHAGNGHHEKNWRFNGSFLEVNYDLLMV